MLTGENPVPAMIHRRAKLPKDAADAQDSKPAGAGRVAGSARRRRGRERRRYALAADRAAFEGEEHGEAETEEYERGGYEHEHKDYEDD